MEDIRGTDAVAGLLDGLKAELLKRTGLDEPTLMDLYNRGKVKVKGRASRFIVYVEQ